ncbi:hypothetical protein OE88DRAFT_1808633 [Heliocybe sulcata]|uniref:Uncharacterized protein n=1 Tax=Heliocybe sulcata TaxID=5364 RepID=A0A5C3N420_9AGAM|nr:hypothetical protein OE88DRAFT_1808633 [Heliocybe sulcata]
MSRIVFERDAQQYRVGLPRLRKLPPNPHIYDAPTAKDAALARANAPPSESAQADSELPTESTSLKRLRHRLLAHDQRSFLTGSAVPDLQVAHILNAVRRNSVRKQGVESFLLQQGLSPQTYITFDLDAPINAILLEASLHVQWDTYGTFCFVPAEANAVNMLEALRQSNQDWEHLVRLNPFLRRPLDVTAEPYNRPMWDVILLHPYAMLPEGQPLAIAQNRTFHQQGQPSPEPRVTWTSWIASGDHLVAASAPHEPLAPFIASDIRDRVLEPPISSLAMVINAHSKLDAFMRDHGATATPRIQRYSQLMSDLVTEIFFVPEGRPNVAAQEYPRRGSAEDAGMAGAPPPDQTMHQSPDEENEPGSRQGTPRPGDNTSFVDTPAEAPESPAEDGLTDTEFRLVEAKARDPKLAPKARANAAMMMLFGTRDYRDYNAERAHALRD